MSSANHPSSTSMFVDSNGKIFRIGSLIGQGGEGTIYEVVGDSSIVLKIYKDPMSKDRFEKLNTMVKFHNSDLDKITAWPRSLVFKKDGHYPVGFTMRRFSSRRDIYRLYNPKSRLTDFPQADWRFLIRTASNIARTFSAVHATTSVIGDVNHGSVLVGADATVALIDCDSFQISDGQKIYRCAVGVDTFTPPELQFKNFSSVLRLHNHDNFGLAVLIFMLLMMGRHPFSGKYSGQGDLLIAQSIADYRFAYGKNSAKFAMQQPPGTASLSSVGPLVSDLFERAFDVASAQVARPCANEWLDALVKLEMSLIECSRKKGHWHIKRSRCPWCQIEEQTKRPLFPDQGATNRRPVIKFPLMVGLVGLSFVACVLYYSTHEYFRFNATTPDNSQSPAAQTQPSATPPINPLEKDVDKNKKFTESAHQVKCDKEIKIIDDRWESIRTLNLEEANCATLKAIQSQLLKTLELGKKCPQFDLRYAKPENSQPLLEQISKRKGDICKSGGKNNQSR